MIYLACLAAIIGGGAYACSGVMSDAPGKALLYVRRGLLVMMAGAASLVVALVR